ncbi:VirB4 family type IV secretion/conjugal transfer ATPase [Janthinobacterium sp. FW305-128]|uniref:VirB4 family type IV secretion/conjugal transfer ATPase n=1 Tax=Janthinobacterium sp. FW305-128 TaxID=2775055 RepID=UPI001E409DA7|nr:VirB4 family type IV secretion/conjugal transfer ATPase [Janthinobacterium sp. FW305-128]MCC7684726.1 VirB4 family type IV secretion/conjugal transfer ATPase [Janthinobacterium sp. FW305-128]
MGAEVKYSKESAVEEDCSQFIPQGNQISTNTIKLIDGGYMQTIRLQGAAHESADTQDINDWHNHLNNWLRNLASPHVAIWTHMVKREYNKYPGGEFDIGFCRELDAAYKEKMSGTMMLINELYVSIVYRPEPIAALKAFDFFAKKSKEELIQKQEEELLVINELVNSCMASLDRYEPELLGVYEHNGFTFSEIAEFLGYLLNGEWRRMPLLRASFNQVLSTSRPFFGKGGLMSYKTPTSVIYAGILAIQEYPDPTPPTLLNGLLSLPFEFVLTQSLTFISKGSGVGRMKRQQDRMINAGDVAESQIKSLTEAMDGLASGEYVMGAHHLTLIIKSDDKADLADCISLAGNELSEVNIKWAREDDAIAGAFYSQLPGNFKFRTRVGDITSRNFSAFASFHNYPIGHLANNQWGHAVAMLKTSSGAPYYFNFHKGEKGNEAKRLAKLDPNHKDLANMIVIGESGKGKTVLEMFLLSMLQKFTNGGTKKLTSVVIDKDEGASVGIRAMGGNYYTLRNGERSGLQPLQMPITEDNILFVLKLLMQIMAVENSPYKPSEKELISLAVRSVMNEKTPKKDRRLLSVLEFFNQGEEDGLYSRLFPWTALGDLGWLLDNEEDTLSLDTSIVGIDVTAFLKNPQTRTPTIMYLFHRIEQMQDGRRIPIFLDEFGQLLNDPAFADFADDKLVTIRKRDGFLVMFTQFPRQVLDQDIGAAIVSQTATQIFLPNTKASYADYVEGFKCTRREWEIIKELGTDANSRYFLIKQGDNSVVAELNLNGMHDFLAVLSGNTVTAALSEKMVNEYGPNPDIWLPKFHEARKGV